VTPDELVAAVGAVARTLPVRGMSVAQYDPERDDERGTALTAALDLVERLMDTVGESPQTHSDDKNAVDG
jgi:arginase family enzyme